MTIDKTIIRNYSRIYFFCHIIRNHCCLRLLTVTRRKIERETLREMVRVNERVRNWDCESGRVREWMRVWDSLRCSVKHVCFIDGYNFVCTYGSALFKFVSLQGRIMVNFVPNYSIQCLLRVCFLVFIQVLHTQCHTQNDT